MTTLSKLRLKKNEDRRIRAGHPWIFSNEIDTTITPLKNFTPGQEIGVEAHDQTFLGVGYINPHSLIAVRLFSRHPEERLDAAFFKQRFQTALALRTRLFTAPYYRLVFSEADGLPGLVIDRFANDWVVQINTAGMEQQTALIATTLCSLVPETRSILLRNDSPVREQEQLPIHVSALFGTPPEEITLEENAVTFTAPLWKGQKTGWFYDHRLNRARLKHYVVDKNVLDVFSYLGGFGIQAAVFGAASVDCIEASSMAGEFILKNAQQNGVAEKVHVINEDAFIAMKTCLQQNKQYDVIIIDPPAFVKRFKDRKEGLIAYQRINELAVKLLRPEGILVSCSCSMQVSMEDLLPMLQRIAFRTHSQLQILERGHQGPDHPLHLSIPESDYLKAIFVRKIA